MAKVDNKTKIFLDKLKKSGYWNNDYDYSKLIYTGIEEKVIVIDEFGFYHLISPYHLLQGNRLTIQNAIDKNEYFIFKAKLKHGDKYMYQYSNYTIASAKIIITCIKHGNFEVTANNFLRGKGCGKCVGRHKTTSEIIEDFKKLNNKNCDYSLVDYKGVDVKVKIICKEHGVFEQTPFEHLMKSNCPKCIGRNKSIEDLKKLFNKKHNNKYQYLEINNTKQNSIISITCSKHGTFEQKIKYHLRGGGCLKCGANLIEDRGYVSFEECSSFAKTLGLTSKKQWEEYCKSGNKPDNIPHNPQEYYNNK